MKSPGHAPNLIQDTRGKRPRVAEILLKLLPQARLPQREAEARNPAQAAPASLFRCLPHAGLHQERSPALSGSLSFL